ncbi:MAG TPA: 3'-5' exonuclease [Saprospiraceae bacterium]|nr:3'-5' exonuclease [Saprospiraceae bacterium]HMQ81275.1 3'-5' exonuclease [Saprospiraceae bacterium]
MPEFWEAYRQKMQQSYTYNTPIEKVRFVVFDTETTGLNVKKDHLLSIGAVSIQNFQLTVKDSFECFVQQSYQSNGESIRVHGILPVMKSHQMDEWQAVAAFTEFLSNGVLVGHHVGFDIGMVNKVLKTKIKQKLWNKKIDTLDMAIRLSPSADNNQRESLGLDHLCQKYQIPVSDRHTSAGDALITGILFMKLLARLQDRGIKTLGQLLHKPMF